MTIEELDNIRFNFIVARGRSGTTLLRSMLNAHSQVISPIESKLIIHLKKKYSKIENWNAKTIDQFIEHLFLDIKFQRFWHVDKALLRKNIAALPLDRMSFSSLLKVIYLTIPSNFEKKEIAVIVDKNPPYSIFLDDLKSVFPDAKYIHMIRDPRDNILSDKKTNPIKNINVLSVGWLMYNKEIESFKRKNADKFYTLKYEDLVKDPVRYIAEVCDYLGVKYEESMVHYQQKLKDEIDLKAGGKEKHLNSFNDFHGNLVKPINTSSVGKWETGLSNKELESVRYICADQAKKYGYELNAANSGVLLFFQKQWAFCLYKLDCFILKSYYKLPFSARNFIRFISDTVYRMFGVTTIYNKVDQESNEG